MERKGIIVGDEEKFVELEFQENIVEFVIYDIDLSTLHEQLKGAVKWDGCSNVESDACMHFCEPMDFMFLFESMRIAYNESAKYFNDKKSEGRDELPMWGE